MSRSTKKINASNKVKGGIGDRLPFSKVDPDQLKMGINVEKEHTKKVSVAKDIARDHLKEFPRYYDALRKMETKLKKNAAKRSIKKLLHNKDSR